MARYFYEIKSPTGRPGFGVTGDPTNRIKKYTSHCGYVMQFRNLWHGPTSHINTFERIIKTFYADKMWMLDGWQTEWLDNGITFEDFHQIVLDELNRRKNLKLVLVAENFNYQSVI